MTDAPRRLLLVDGSGYIFRAFFALPPMTRADGTPINAVYGFCNMLWRLMQDRPDDDILVVFDHSGESFRNAIPSATSCIRSLSEETTWTGRPFSLARRA